MAKYTLEQRLEIIKFYYQNQCSVVKTLRELRRKYGRRTKHNERCIRRLVSKFETTFSLHDVAVPVRAKSARTKENIEAVQQSVKEDSEMSIPRRSQALNISQTTTWRILLKDLGLHPYKIQLMQELKPADHALRRGFAAWALKKLTEDPFFYRKIIFTDEAHFWLNGFVNKQNCRIWSNENPHAILEKPLHPLKVTVWCGIHAGGVIGPYFFRNEQGQHVTVNGERYRAMLTDYVFPKVEENDLGDYFFQQDGATCHTATETMNLLRNEFGEEIISKNGPINYPPRSCDLTPCDFFLWGFVKSQVYRDKPATIEHLIANIERVIAEIEADLCEKVMVNWTERLRYVQRSRGGHMNDIIFHM